MADETCSAGDELYEVELPKPLRRDVRLLDDAARSEVVVNPDRLKVRSMLVSDLDKLASSAGPLFYRDDAARIIADAAERRQEARQAEITRSKPVPSHDPDCSICRKYTTRGINDE